jgi:hypothetical protein
MVGEAPSTRNHFGGVTPFKVQVNFDIPLFEGQIDANALEKWLNILEGYYLFKKFSTLKRSPSLSLNPSPMSNIGGNVTRRDIMKMSLWNLGQDPLG